MHPYKQVPNESPVLALFKSLSDLDSTKWKNTFMQLSGTVSCQKIVQLKSRENELEQVWYRRLSNNVVQSFSSNWWPPISVNRINAPIEIEAKVWSGRVAQSSNKLNKEGSKKDTSWKVSYHIRLQHNNNFNLQWLSFTWKNNSF
jgi:hypothetical protein